MKKDGRYRFSLQFDTATDERKIVGEFLEKLGNKKSAFIVSAVAEYLRSHPEISIGQADIRIRMEPGVNRKELEEIIRSIINEKYKSPDNYETQQNKEMPRIANDDDLQEMLNNLDIFDMP